MCGIAGFFNPSADYTKEKNYRNHILEMMNQVQKHRGPDDEGTFLSPQCGLAHVRLNIIDLVHRTSADETRQRRSQLCHCI